MSVCWRMESSAIKLDDYNIGRSEQIRKRFSRYGISEPDDGRLRADKEYKGRKKIAFQKWSAPCLRLRPAKIFISISDVLSASPAAI